VHYARLADGPVGELVSSWNKHCRALFLVNSVWIGFLQVPEVAVEVAVVAPVGAIVLVTVNQSIALSKRTNQFTLFRFL
jgi:hypothetical protein